MSARNSTWYTLVQEGEFPAGLRCAECSRIIKVDKPYMTRLIAATEDSIPIAKLVCVYC